MAILWWRQGETLPLFQPLVSLLCTVRQRWTTLETDDSYSAGLGMMFWWRRVLIRSDVDNSVIRAISLDPSEVCLT